MRKISADYIFPVSSPPIKNGIVIVDDDGQIVDVIDPTSNLQPPAFEFYEGVMVPGFVNTHCHLELSYLKDKMPRSKGLDEFVSEVENVRRNFSEEEILNSLAKAEDEMIKNGIVAVGDISNSDFS